MASNDLKCKYCGNKFVAGFTCQHSPTKKHIALTNGITCVYCGQKFIAGFTCNYSPTKKHQLDS